MSKVGTPKTKPHPQAPANWGHLDMVAHTAQHTHHWSAFQLGTLEIRSDIPFLDLSEPLDTILHLQPPVPRGQVDLRRYHMMLNWHPGHMSPQSSSLWRALLMPQL